MKYTAKSLKNWDLTRQAPTGEWKPARPISNTSLLKRLEHALMVILGKYDVVDWEE